MADEQDEPVEAEPLRGLAERVLTEEGLPRGTEVSVVLVGPKAMRHYNERFMQGSGPTDVLAFPLEHLHPGDRPVVQPNEPPVNLGDVFVCPSIVKGHADAAGVSLDDEMAHMVVHGMLHLLGYDHGDDAQAERMESRERELLSPVTPR